MVICSEYKSKLLHIFIPPYETIVKLCLSVDKTSLFLTTILRFIFYLSLFVILYVGGILSFSYKNELQFLLSLCLLTILILTAFSVILVLIKNPLYKTKSQNSELNETGLQLITS